jgi:predicted DNA-binding WGR domain protein
MRAGKVGKRGKSTTTAYPTIAKAEAAARARVKELIASGYAHATLAEIS